MASNLRSEITDQDLAAAQEQAQDQGFEAKVLSMASTAGFWDSLVFQKAVEPKEKGLMVDWLTMALEGHSQADFLEECGSALAALLIKLVGKPAAISTFDGNAALRASCADVALAALSLFLSPKGSLPDDDVVTARAGLFRAIAAEAWAAAAGSAEYAALDAKIEGEFARAQAKAAAALAELEITGGKREQQLVGEPTSPRVEPQRDLAELGPLRDGGVFQALLSVLTATSAQGKLASSGFQLRKAVVALSTIVARDVSGAHPVHRHLFRWIAAQLAAPQTQVAALTGLKQLLKNPALHVAFEAEQTMHALSALLKRETKNMQPLYLAGFCVWLLTFNKSADGLLHAFSVVAKLCAIVRVVGREKVLRICLATLLNLVGRASFTEEMVGVELHNVLPVVAARKWKDDDIAADANALLAVLQKRIAELSSFELYVSELQAGALRKSPVHSEKFWRANVLRFEDNNFVLVKTLVAQLASEREESLEMACYDLGEFARFHPDGKKVLSKLDAKPRLMALMSHKDAAVAKAALLAVQKVLVQKWDQMMAAGGPGKAASS